ncbi:long-chain-fatty-acid--CoA ligase [Paraburkholderia sp. UYCP14C]|uniref:long-chain-fatty-acid--CoA ligase n=1 Tax=Paraburkholderia sp. UYCP14C TaxID=2511130 RepID=UPI0010229C40|nr:long-chain-fatty-acid--CoA ligase [Paraburkholderia sp. UYCP14C]RZF26767.1 long-chain-fatty-acid--CoA ligase [Paraburkholderia sp. UYCP14C]
MHALMQQRPLLISGLIEHAATYHGDREIVSCQVDGSILRSDWRQLHARAKRLANVLTGFGVQAGDRVATLAWNTHRHVELYFGVSGMGAVLHTVNPRLFAEQIVYILNHAESRYVFFDTTFTDLVAKIAPQCPHIKGFVALCSRAQMPALNVARLYSYEDLLDGASAEYAWPVFEETRASSLCYTSGTTGNPKGVLYSHRSTVLHTFAACAADGLGLSANDSVLLVVPLFHVNAWGVPYAAAMCGAKLVLPGPGVGGESIFRLLRDEACNFSLGVPTVWLGLFDYIEGSAAKLDVSTMRLKRVVVGGSAAPRAIIEKFEKHFGAFVIQVWGMSETSSPATIGNLLPKHAGLPLERRFDLQVLQGRAIYGVEIEIFDADGSPLPHDGKVFGELKVRGPWVAGGYYRGDDGAALDDTGWFPTGDVATIDRDGFVRITDRSKDVIKSGGEWISSIDLENAAVGHEAVQEAAVIGIAHRRWQERPLLVVVKRPDKEAAPADILAYLQDKITKWWLPDDVVFVDALPHTATGKVQKLELRERFKGYRLPTDQS